MCACMNVWSLPCVQEQYIFLHDAMLESVTCGDTQITAADLRLKIKKYDKVDASTGLTTFQSQFNVRGGRGEEGRVGGGGGEWGGRRREGGGKGEAKGENEGGREGEGGGEGEREEGEGGGGRKRRDREEGEREKKGG